MISKETSLVTLPDEKIISKILIIRGRKVMIDRDLAKLYQVPTGRLNEQVKRNFKRFPEDFMFQLNKEELKNLISQNAISSWGGTRKWPHVFTEQGVAMLSSILNSDRAIDVNIQIMRTFTKLREMLATNEQLRQKIEAMEQKYHKNFKVVFQVIKQLLQKEAKPKTPIGFHLT